MLIKTNKRIHLQKRQRLYVNCLMIFVLQLDSLIQNNIIFVIIKIQT